MTVALCDLVSCVLADNRGVVTDDETLRRSAGKRGTVDVKRTHEGSERNGELSTREVGCSEKLHCFKQGVFNVVNDCYKQAVKNGLRVAC